jgi:hypothetical protein
MIDRVEDGVILLDFYAIDSCLVRNHKGQLALGIEEMNFYD